MVKNVAVVGAGTMGSSIALCVAKNEVSVFLKDVNQEVLAKGMENIERMLSSLAKRGLSAQECEAIKSRIVPVDSFEALKDVDLVIEVVPEDLAIKKSVLSALDNLCKKDCVIASNTSSFSITQLGSFTKSPHRVVGMHFFNPAHVMELVEVIPGLLTSNQTVKAAITFGENLGKLAVRVEECASFLVNRLLGRYANEAIWCLQEKIATVEEIDQAACDLLMPIGPLALRDMNGLDIGLAVAQFNFNEYGERFRPPDLLENLVAKKQLGRKVHSGFYIYDAETRKKLSVNPALASELAVFERGGSELKFEARRLFLPMVNEAFLVLQEKICAPDKIDLALKAGLNMRKGPLEYASEVGFDVCLAEIEELFLSCGERFRPAPLLKRYVWAGRTSVS
jgi:3-hydroxyacyl-CoA dehydrogenase